MKKTFFLLLSLFFVSTARFDITFDSPDARITMGYGAAINYNPRIPIQIDTGILRASRASLFTGKPFIFSSFIVEESPSAYAHFQGVAYDARDVTPEVGTLATVILNGYGKIEAVGGFNLYDVIIGGTGNVISGAPLFNYPLSLGNGVGLTLGLTVPMPCDITLDDSTLYLASDLIFESGALIKGIGTISGGTHAIRFDENVAGLSSDELTWLSCKNMQIKGHTPISGDWIIEGNCYAQGSNSLLDLRPGGRLVIKPDSEIHLRDIVVKGIRGGASKNIVFQTPGQGQEYGKLYMSGCRLEFYDEYSMNNGTFWVEGDTVFALVNHNVIFTGGGKLVVEDSTLFLNVISNTNTLYTGTVGIPDALYDEDHIKQTEAMAAGIQSGNLELIGRGVITEMTSGAVIDSGGGNPVYITQGGLLPPGEALSYFSNTVLNGSGSRLSFSNSSTSQFNVAAGITVRLQNITLDGVTSSTFNLGENAVVEIGENVTFILAENIVWSSGRLSIVGSGNTFKIRGLGTQRMLYFHSTGIGQPNNLTYSTHLSIGVNSVELNNVVLKGLRHVTFDTQSGVSGDIVLAGDAVLETDSDEYVVPHFFVIEGLNNTFRLRSDNVTFQGRIKFDPVLHSLLTFSFILSDELSPTPTIHFASQALTVSSELGVAYCVFDVPSVKICNEAINAFRLGNNGWLKGNRIVVFQNSIQQTTARTTVFPGVQLLSSLPSGAINLSDDLLDAMRSPGEQFSVRQLEKQIAMKRALSLPNENTVPVIHYDSAVALPVIAGNFELRELYGQVYTNAKMSSEQPINLTFYNGVRTEQAANTAATLKSGDIINIVGGTVFKPNTLGITQNLTINGALMFDDNAVFCIEGTSLSTPSTVRFNSTAQLSFGQNAQLIFRGNIVVSFQDGFEIAFGSSGGMISVGSDASLVVTGGTQVVVTGTGTLQCQDGGQIIVSNGATLKIGSSLSDDITLRAKLGGSVLVGDAVISYGSPSYLSFAGSYCAADFSQGGSLCITRYGTCEMNAYHGAARTGVMRRIDFSNGGSLYVGQGGALWLNGNLSSAAIYLSLYGATIGGVGTVGLVGTAFKGQIQPNIFSWDEFTAVQIVRGLIQTVPRLIEATVYIDGGQTKLRTANGVLVNLDANQIITNDSEVSRIAFGYNALTGRRFSYDANGVLR